MSIEVPSPATDPVGWLRTTHAVRERCHGLLREGERGALPHFHVRAERLDAAADYVAAVVRERYPDLRIPYHSRWRHFATAGIDRWHALESDLVAPDRDEVARIRFDLCVPSVLLDAGAGGDWIYTEPGTHLGIARSEGLAVATFHDFKSGAFSADPENPLRSDAERLRDMSEEDVAACFQVGPGNDLAGLKGRALLMRRLGEAMQAAPDFFGMPARIGNLYDHIAGKASGSTIPAAQVLAIVLQAFGPIWPSRLSLRGENLGDVWRHSAAVADDETGGFVPFHKLSQWLTYSLIEILEDAGLRVADLDALTGLPEYRNGGLFVDLGVLVPKDPALADRALAVDEEAVVEWRALTLALLDAIADPVRSRLGVDASAMPLACVLEGGTWAAGRKIAKERRAGGAPPLLVISDGTVF